MVGTTASFFTGEAVGGGTEAPFSALRTSFVALPVLLDLALATVCCIDFATHPLLTGRLGENPTGPDRTDPAVARWATLSALTIIALRIANPLFANLFGIFFI